MGIAEPVQLCLSVSRVNIDFYEIMDVKHPWTKFREKTGGSFS